MPVRRPKQRPPKKSARAKRPAHGIGSGRKKRIRVTLSPAQASAHDALVAALRFARVLVVWGDPGFGKSTVLHTFISGSHDFYQKIQSVAEAAKHNAPSIIFIDDSDV